jgi:hypothetical protein
MDPLTTVNYTVDYTGVSIIFYPRTFSNNAINNLTFVFSSPSGLFESYGYNISFPGGFESFDDNNAVGEEDTVQINISGAVFLSTVNITTFYKSELESDYRVYHYQYLIEGYSSANYTFVDLKNRDFGMGQLEKVLLAIGVLIVVFAIASLSAGILAGVGITILLFAMFTYLGYIPLWGTIISVFVLFILLAMRSSR